MYDYISKLDSHRFGFKVAKISGKIENPDFLINELKNISTKLVIARIDLSDINLINQLEKIGFTYKDCQVTYSFNLKTKLPEKKQNHFSLVSFNIRHLSEMIEITRKSFNNYGHYFADNKLDKQKCLEIYSDWLQRCCEDKDYADEIIVAEKDDLVVGYLTLKKNFAEKEKYFSGVIGAVSPEYRKLGVFQAINTESLHLAESKGADYVENNVLVTNFPVMRSYSSLGYRIIRAETTMHFWYD